MGNFMNEKVIPKIMAFINTKAIRALKDGLLFIMPLTIIGSIFLILANIPYTPVATWISSHGYDVPMDQAYGATFSIIALFATMGITYVYVKNDGYEALSPAIISACTFILLIRNAVDVDGTEVGNLIPKDFLGGKGMVGAILVGLIVGWIYSWFMKKDIRIKMPEGVPPAVAGSFTALIPGVVIITAATIIFAVCDNFGTTMMDVIYNVIQSPLQGVTDSLGGVIVMSFCIPFLWWFGVHGSTVISGIMTGILTSNTSENQAILDAGKELTVANGGHIVTQQFLDQFITVTGAGVTLGIVLYMLMFAKSAQYKQLGKLSIGPGLFNINEPVLFATPIVMNPFMFIPFIAMPVISGVVEYLAMAIGLCPLYGGVIVPWTTPPVISGFLIGGWRTALLQAFVIVLSFFVYLPFIKRQDNQSLKMEQEAAKGNK